MTARTGTAQPGIFALGASDHCYLEFDLTGALDPFLRAAAGLALELTSTVGVSVVLGVRPTLWNSADPERTDVADFTEPITGADGFTMPATQHDAWMWIAGGDRTTVFDAGRQAIAALAPHARVAGETGGWVYRQVRDLTGFVDGTENPSVLEARDAAAADDGTSVLLFQLWRHHTGDWDAQPQSVQEDVIGRTKPDSIELDPKPDDSHVARTVVEVDGQEQHIYRRNHAYGTVADHGTVFVGFAREHWRLAEMLRRMAGVDGPRDALTRFTTPLSGAYYVVPSLEALAHYTADQAAE